MFENTKGRKSIFFDFDTGVTRTGRALLPKDIVTESPPTMKNIARFGDLVEDAGERAHQEEARNESRMGTVVNLAKKDRTKSQFEAMKKSEIFK